MEKYIKPEYIATRFTCPFCSTLAGIEWTIGYATLIQDGDNTNMFYIASNKPEWGDSQAEIGVSYCRACERTHIWKDGVMIFPENTGIVMPREDMPSCVKEIYEEARIIYSKSSKAAAALLRLALQKLCKELGYKGDNINNDIAEMVRDGLPPRVQKVLDIIRVTGNEAVHPGTIDFTDDDNIAIKLFDMLNFIVDKMITDPKEIDALYDRLPADKLAAIEKRDER